MKTNAQTSKISQEQLSIVLMAISTLEGWDGEHTCIKSDPETGWALVRGVNGYRMPVPSQKLINLVDGLQK